MDWIVSKRSSLRILVFCRENLNILHGGKVWLLFLYAEKIILKLSPIILLKRIITFFWEPRRYQITPITPCLPTGIVTLNLWFY